MGGFVLYVIFTRAMKQIYFYRRNRYLGRVLFLFVRVVLFFFFVIIRPLYEIINKRINKLFSSFINVLIYVSKYFNNSFKG